MKNSNRPEPAGNEILAADLKREGKELNEKYKPSFEFEEVWLKYEQAGNPARANRRPFSRWLRWGAGIAVSLIVASGALIGIGTVSPEVAEALRSIPFFDYLYAKGVDTDELNRIEEKSLSASANASVVDKGIKFNVINVYYDGIQIVLNYEVSYPESTPKLTNKEAAVYYNLSFSGIQPDSISTHDFTITGEHTFVGTTRMSIGEKDMPAELWLNMAVDCIGTTKGKWDVSIYLNKKKSDELTKIVYPNGLEFNYKNTKYSVDKLVFGPVTTQVVIGNVMPYYQFDLVMEDDIGNLYKNYGGSGATQDYYYFNLPPLSELNPNPKYVTLTLTEHTDNDDSLQADVYKQLDEKYPIVLQGDLGGTLSITGIEYGEKETVVYYEANKELNRKTRIVLEDKQGAMIFTQSQPVRTNRDKLTFKLRFPPMDKNNVAAVVAHPITISNKVQTFKFQIPLEWDIQSK
ncbi:DUF4179 domain-containing protein [Paenibacillus sp. P32E]|uniref:DUF4179 domain-containing protein n=1 Tax=Paenibacillus sp. P32E TaxID=1349434 RepID=UPI00093A2C53|nr:DUF4179 domain-containing protein [Paenibacillus sp. P32E]OKP92411.1 hypothetical protein A3848_08085 [Paenibacillus sp. P32E]